MRARTVTTLGALRGRAVRRDDREVAAFLGIPFAAPPVDALRFAPPRPARPWAGERDAVAFGAAPHQAGGALLELLGTAVHGLQSEDCLSLNVWTPGVDGGRRPVLVWIHGGAFISGASGAPVYDGARLAARGDLVVVTFNYRVGALGYLHLDGSDGPGSPVCTNLGLLDQIAALAFVRENAPAFGGDPDRVTVFGESAGAGSIGALLAAPAARGLFRGAIVQSGAPDGYLTPEDAHDRTARLLEVLGVAPSALPALPARALVEAQHKCAAERVWKTGMFFTPVVDGEVLPVRPMAAIRDGQAARVPLVIGTTRDELQLYKYGSAAPALGDEAVAAVIAGSLPASGAPSAAEVLATCRQARAARGESLEGIDLVYAFQTDLMMRGPAIRLAEHHARHQPDTFMYLFDQTSPVQGGELGACHALDVPFAFGNVDEPAVQRLVGSGDAPRSVAEQMTAAWIAFAWTGRPGPAGAFDWPAYTPERRATRIIGPRPRVEDAPREPERRVLADLVAALTP